MAMPVCWIKKGNVAVDLASGQGYAAIRHRMPMGLGFALVRERVDPFSAGNTVI
jgi:hypothetical protein